MIRLLKKGSFFIVIAAAVIIFLIATKDDDVGESNYDFSSTASASDDDQNQDEDETTEQQTTIAVVDVKGEVKKPGVYEVEIDARVIDVIQLAGGFSGEADETFVNLAQKVQDEMIIHVPKTGEAEQNAEIGEASSSKVKVNYASQEEMESLTGIGPAKAQAIIQYRDENGFFQTPEDLLEISGIGEKTLETIREELEIP